MRIIQVGHYQLRRLGETRVRNEQKFYYGFVRNRHDTFHYSDRDLSAFYSPLGIRPIGRRIVNRKLIEGCAKFKPDLLMIGHCDAIENKTLLEIRRIIPSVRIAYRNFDALYLPRTSKRIEQRQNVVDHIFLSIAGEQIKKFVTPKTNVSYVPNPVDCAIETHDNSVKDLFARDLLFCGNGKPEDPRITFISKLKKELTGLKFETYGAVGHSAVWGMAYDKVLSETKMALNLNRLEGEYLSSSTRLAQLIGNGILTFINEKNGLQRFLEGKAVFFHDIDDLKEKIIIFQNEDQKRKKIAAKGRDFYHRHFSSELVTQYVVERTLGMTLSHDYLWHDVNKY